MVKAILAVNEKFIDLQMAELFIDEAFKYLTYYRKQSEGTIVTWLRMLTSNLENRDNNRSLSRKKETPKQTSTGRIACQESMTVQDNTSSI